MHSHRHIDRILQELQKYKESILNDLNPDVIIERLSPDHGCMRRMGNLEGDSLFSCDSCEYIGRLTDLDRGVPDKLKVGTGRYEGKTFTIKETKSVSYGCRWDDEAEERYKKIDQIEGISECGLTGSNIVRRYLSSDMWLNEVLINWQIGRIFDHKGLPHLNNIITNFVCGNNGYVLEFDQVKPLTEKDQLSEIEAYCLLQQLLSIFLTLKPYKFVHGSCTIDKLSYTDQGCGYAANNLEITGPFTLYLSGFMRSSINVDDTRLIPSTVGADVRLSYSVENFNPVIRKFKLGKSDIETHTQSSGPLVYSVDGTGPILLTTMRYSGYPIFGGSYDLYSIIVSLMSWPPFRCAVNKSDHLSAIIRNIFVDNTRLPVIREDNIRCSLKIALTLSGVLLYCDSIEIFRDLLERYKIPSLRDD